MDDLISRKGAIDTLAEWNDEAINNRLNNLPAMAELKPLAFRRVIFNWPATIVFWSDGTKTVVKCAKFDNWDPEKGLAMAVMKKFLPMLHGNALRALIFEAEGAELDRRIDKLDKRISALEKKYCDEDAIATEAAWNKILEEEK